MKIMDRLSSQYLLLCINQVLVEGESQKLRRRWDPILPFYGLEEV